MTNINTNFWIGLLFLGDDVERRSRFWNGYLGWRPHVKEENEKEGWPKLIVDPPGGGWPELTESDEVRIEKLAEHYGGHPK